MPESPSPAGLFPELRSPAANLFIERQPLDMAENRSLLLPAEACLSIKGRATCLRLRQRLSPNGGAALVSCAVLCTEEHPTERLPSGPGSRPIFPWRQLRDRAAFPLTSRRLVNPPEEDEPDPLEAEEAAGAPQPQPLTIAFADKASRQHAIEKLGLDYVKALETRVSAGEESRPGRSTQRTLAYEVEP